MSSRGFYISFATTLLFLVAANSANAESSPPAETPSSAPQASPAAVGTPSVSPAATQPSSSANSPSTNSSGTTTRLPDVAITATRITQPLASIGTTITVVHAQQIQDQKIQQVSDALREVPGVEVTQSGGPGTITDVSIRGATSSQVLVLLDGVEVNSPTAGSYDFANLTTDNTGRIEVLRGAGGSLYGSSAIGGVINLISQEGTGAPKFSLLSDGGNWETQRQVATASGADGKLGYSESISYYSTNGFQPVNSAYDNLSSAGRLDWHVTDNTTLRGFARYTTAQVGLPEYSNEDFGAPLDPNANQRDEFMLFKGEVDSHPTEKLSLRYFGSFVRDEIRDNKTPDPINNYFNASDVPEEIWGSNGEAVYTWMPNWVSLVGFDFKNLWARSVFNSIFYTPPPCAKGAHNTECPNVSNTVFTATQQQYAGYLQQQGSLFHDHVLVTGGFRVDGNSQFGEEVSPSWALAIPLNKYGITLRGNYAEGFEAPTFDDLYYPEFGNPNLQPTTSSEYDGSIEKRFGELGSFTATYFSRRIHDLIVAAPNTAVPGEDIAENIGRTDTQGVEFVPSIHPFKGFSLSGNFTELDSTHVPLLASLQPVRVPKHSAAGVAEYKYSNLFRDGDEFTSALFYQFVGDFEDLQTQPPYGYASHGSYHVFNLTLSYDLGNGVVPRLTSEEAFVRIQNLFDRNYTQDYGYPAAPINFEAGLKVSL
ncbi:MAG TPA: TonB-dependent receptor [Candidatus Binataceae bacterium]|nr:TonB-dependent receptor [Candidatus Binataceae bacterium]